MEKNKNNHFKKKSRIVAPVEKSGGEEVVNKIKEFRISAKHLFLTYPQCSIPIGSVFKLLSELLTFDRYLIVREKHASGDYHYHVYLRSEKKFSIKSPDRLHLSFEGVTYKGNYQAAKYPSGSINYLLKDIDCLSLRRSDYLCSKDLSLMIKESGVLMNLDESMLVLARKGDVKSAMDLLEFEDVRRFIVSGAAIKKRLEGLYMESAGFTTKFSMKNFDLPAYVRDGLDEWAASHKTNSSKVLMIVGESGSGKTELVLSYISEVFGIRPRLISCYDGVSKVFKDQGIIFDDFDWESLDRSSTIALLDPNERIINVKYSSLLMPGNTAKAITANTYSFNIHDHALCRRLIVIDLKANKVFHIDK
jgi:hypothetical protein